VRREKQQRGRGMKETIFRCFFLSLGKDDTIQKSERKRKKQRERKRKKGGGGR
jgi:hypothetical protein